MKITSDAFKPQQTFNGSQRNHIITKYFFNQEEVGTKLNSSTPTQSHPSSLPSPDATFLAILVALGALAAITAGLLLHLCFFHIYISYLGLTTYEYIKHQRQTSDQPPTSSNRENESSEQQLEHESNNSTLRHR